MLESNIEIKEAFGIGIVWGLNWEFKGVFGYQDGAAWKFI